MRNPLNRIEAVYGDKIKITKFGRSGRVLLEVNIEFLTEVSAWLRMEESNRMDFLEALTVFESKSRFFLSYFLRSHSQNIQLVLRTSVAVPTSPTRINAPSMIGIWPQVEPFETELAPLFGIEFTGAKRVGAVRKNFGEFGGYPLRKSYEWIKEVEP